MTRHILIADDDILLRELLIARLEDTPFTHDIATDGAQALKDSQSIRRTALTQKIPYYTTVAGAAAAVQSISALRTTSLDVEPLQAHTN